MMGFPDFFAALMAEVALAVKAGLPLGKSLARAKLVAAARRRRMVFFMWGEGIEGTIREMRWQRFLFPYFAQIRK